MKTRIVQNLSTVDGSLRNGTIVYGIAIQPSNGSRYSKYPKGYQHFTTEEEAKAAKKKLDEKGFTINFPSRENKSEYCDIKIKEQP